VANLLAKNSTRGWPRYDKRPGDIVTDIAKTGGAELASVGGKVPIKILTEMGGGLKVQTGNPETSHEGH